MKIIKELHGSSGSKLLLIEENNQKIVRKINNIYRNLERFKSLSDLDLKFPKIFNVEENYYDMEYISGLSIKNYLLTGSLNNLIYFLINTINQLSKNSFNKDYTEIYNKKLTDIDFKSFTFSKNELIDKLPKILPCSNYHGDLTLENIIYNTQTNQFYLIDPLTTEYDSYVFDLAKLQQDIKCKWFIRNDQIYLESKLNVLSEFLEKNFSYYNNNYILILMLLRVLPYTTDKDQIFIINEVNKLWK